MLKNERGTRCHCRAVAVAACLTILVLPGLAEASYTSTVVGTTASMIGNGASDTLSITQAGGIFFHNRFPIDPGFQAPNDFDSAALGIQTVPTSGIININAGDGDDVIALGDGVNTQGTINGGIGADTLDYSAYTTPVRVNLGLGASGFSVIQGPLGADQEVPPTTHAGTGVADISNYNPSTRTFRVDVEVFDFPPGDVTGLRIHQQNTGVNGAIIVDLTFEPRTPAGSGFTMFASGLTLPAASEAALLGGGTYLNIQTATFPSGAIRAQLLPRLTTTATGAATGTVSVANVENAVGGASGDSIVGNGSVNVLSGGPGNDWIVGGGADDTLNGDAGDDVLMRNHGDGSDVIEGGADGDVVVANGNPVSGQQAHFEANGPRLNFVSFTTSPPYTLDIGTTETFIFNGGDDGEHLVVTPLFGVASMTTFNLNGFGGNDSFDYSEFFLDGIAINVRGGPGTDGVGLFSAPTPVRINLGLSTTGLTATLGADQENPPTTHAGTGTATVSNYNVATGTFDITVTVTDLPPADVIGFHIHQERVGVNGPIIVNFPAGGDPALVPSGTGFTFTAVGLILPEASEAAFLGGGTYVNVHTAVFPAGAIRGQLFSTGNASVTTQAASGTASIAGFENASGGPGNDSLVGTAGVNRLAGDSGNDWILGGPGNDMLFGNGGNDVLVWSNGDGTDVMEGEGGSDTVQVNGSVAAGDQFLVSANGTRLRFDRTNLGLFNLDIGTTETLIANGIGGTDTFTINSLSGVASLSAVNLHGFDGDDVFNVKATATMAPTVRGGPGGADVLNYDAEFRVVSGDTTPPDGVIDSPGAQSTPFLQTETINVTTTAPTVTISDATPVGEGFAPTNALFNVTLSAASPLTVTVNFATADGTAAAPGDYTAQSNTLTFIPGDTVETLSVPINGDALAEATEIFFVNLSGASNVVIADPQGQGSITDNAAPTIGAIASQTIDEDTATAAIAFTVNDTETPVANLTLSGSSSNLALVPNANIVFGGAGASRTVTVMPAAGQSGAAFITVAVSDGNVSASATFTLSVTDTSPPPTNQPPTLSGFADATTFETTPLTLTLTVGDDTTPAANLLVTAASSNTALLPTSGVVLGGSGATRTLTLTPVAEATGQTTVTVTVSDGELATTRTALITVIVAPPPLPPTGLTGSAIGTEVTLTWIEATTGASPTFFVIEGGSGPGLTTLPVIVTPARVTHWTLQLPAGVYFFRVRAANRAGMSAVSNEATVVVTTALQLPGSPTGLAATVVGARVTVGWQPASVGGTPELWQLELGTAPGAIDRGVFAVPSAVTSATGEPGAGEYFARVRGVNAAGVGPVSNETSFRVGDVPACDAPRAPLLLPATVVGRVIGLLWQGPRVTAVGNYRLLAGSTPGGSDLAILDVGPVTSLSAVVPPGRYFFTLLAINACGTSTPSNTIEVVVSAAPPAPGNLRATVNGSQVTLAWNAVAEATSYVLEAGSALGLNDVAVFPLVATGLTVDGVPSGTYYLRVRAVRAGVASIPSAEVIIVVP